MSRICVYMTVKNGFPWIRDAVISVLNQSYTNFKFVIVDDGSTDSTPTFLSSLNDPRIKVVLTNGVGRGAALNMAIKICHSEFVSNIDADDMYHPDKLRIQILTYNMLRDKLKNERIILSSDQIIVSKQTYRDIYWKYPEESGVSNVKHRFIFHNPINHSSVFVPMFLMKEVGGYEISVKTQYDFSLWIKLFEKEVQFFKIRFPLVAKRVHKKQHFENKRRVYYLLSSIKYQKMAIDYLWGKYSFIGYFLILTRLYWGLLPQEIRTFVRTKLKSISHIIK